MRFAPEVFPAPAGINRVSAVLRPGTARVPRASGDKPWIFIERWKFKKCSPRQRG
ncbi:hypothetical protein JT393_004046 [Salmonella enterica]|nr:hypothetical protein [Salmonella enterica]